MESKAAWVRIKEKKPSVYRDMYLRNQLKARGEKETNQGNETSENELRVLSQSHAFTVC